MFKRIVRLLVLALVISGATACKEKQTQAQQTAADEKIWREQQTAKARKAYQDLIKNYPDSPFTAEAQQKLQALGPAATAKK
ncbi:MAG TPA: tetratricopeptide repeat protein [Chthoniobacteraceae bacterium]|jgi:outer membrane protein assembly factor BamD (BamD/ComL family)|nr:tetratricopeptide repeat protein [Chthoniobacteraceae bacterium]